MLVVHAAHAIASHFAFPRPLIFSTRTHPAATERAAVDTACAFALQHAPSEQAASGRSTLPHEYFGLVVYALWQDVELTSDTAITEWLEWAEERQEGGDAAVTGLLALKYTQWLLQQLDEDEDDDEGDEDGSEEEGDDDE
jgi:hypothetical protein